MRAMRGRAVHLDGKAPCHVRMELDDALRVTTHGKKLVVSVDMQLCARCSPHVDSDLLTLQDPHDLSRANSPIGIDGKFERAQCRLRARKERAGRKQGRSEPLHFGRVAMSSTSWRAVVVGGAPNAED